MMEMYGIKSRGIARRGEEEQMKITGFERRSQFFRDWRHRA